MTDIIDQAGELEDKQREQAFEAQRQRAALELKNRQKPQGYCITCFEDFAANDNQKLFCDAKCAQAHR